MFEPAHTIATEGITAGLAERAQPLAVRWPARFVTERVQAEAHVARADVAEIPREHDQHLGVDQRVLATERLHADLPELPIATLLRPLPAEHGPCVPESRRRIAVDHSRVEIRAHDTGRALRTQRQRRPIAVREGVHLLLDDVRRLTDRPPEQLRPLEHGKPDLVEPIGAEDRGGGLFEAAPAMAVRGKDVTKPPDDGDGGGSGHGETLDCPH